MNLSHHTQGGPVHRTRITEIRKNECYQQNYENYIQTIAGGDLAILILEEPKPDAQAGRDYVELWDDEVDGDLVGQTFALMGWGLSGDINDPDAGIWDFHRGYNVVREYVNNKIRYGFEDPANGGLELESVANSGDSGGAATIELPSGERKLIGVCSNGLVDTIYRDPNFPWMNEYASVSGWQRRWIMDNLDSLELGARVEADDQNCNAIVYDTCQDTHFDGAGNPVFDPYGDDCIAYSYFPGWCGQYDSATFQANTMCCACGGG